jgi:flagellar hook protein FlgE
MSITGMMRTSVSGMDAQAIRLASVSSNIANASTVGYKAANTQFSSLVLDAPGASIPSGGVETDVRYEISRQGVLTSTNSIFDLAVSGEGFFLVEDAGGRTLMTRAGSFVPDGDGRLVNAAGYRLLGLPTSSGSLVPVNGTAGLEPIIISRDRLEAMPTSSGVLVTNLPATAGIGSAVDLPSANAPSGVSTVQSSVVVYGSLGQETIVDVHYTKTAPGIWEVAAFDASGRAASGSFPYAAGPLATTSLTFGLDGQFGAGSPTDITIPVPGGVPLLLDLTGTSQLAADFRVLTVEVDGNPPTDAASLEIANDGAIYQTYLNGARRPIYRIPLATVTSPDRLVPKAHNTFEPSKDSGNLLIGSAGSGLGGIVSGALESSTVDMAGELTQMVEAQRNYTANSRVFQTGAELMEVLVNLKR